MAEKRTYTRYELKDKQKVVYRGITDDATRREAEHRASGKKFTHMKTVGPKVKKESARDWESRSLESFRRSHGGRNPKYNRAKNG